MNAPTQSRTGARTARRRPVTGRPGRQDLVDAGFLFALIAVALWGFRTTFDSPKFMAVALVGAGIGIVVAHLATVLRQPWLVLALLTVVAFFLSGGAVAFSGQTLAGVLPTPRSVTALADLSVSGWKDLLTSVPPVDGNGQFVALPYLLGLLAGSLGFGCARRSPRPVAPAAVPALLLAAVILLGTQQPAAALSQGLVFTLTCCCWVVQRQRRRVRVVGAGSVGRGRLAVGAALVAAAAGTGALLGGQLPGAGTQPRTVLRTYVQPPFDISQFPSPLVGYRKYTQGAKLVWDQPLLTVSGLAAGDRLRIAVLDGYSGTVWSAGGSFRKVGTTIAAASVPASGPARTVRITIHDAYAGLADANVWVPGVGYASRLAFSGPGAAQLEDSVRYNADTGQAVVPSRLTSGDVITTTQARVDDAAAGFQPFGPPTLDPATFDFVGPQVAKWAGKAPTPWEQLQAVANTMRTSGAYSDGTATGETQYLPGHSLSRLTFFLAQPQLVGNDEQYAATFALMANDLGIPARVVLGAVVGTGGLVRGQDIHAWVEIRGSDGDWYTVPSTAFVPDRNKHPTPQPPQPEVDARAAHVPPPNATRPTGSLDTAAGTHSTAIRPPRPGFALPAWLVTVLELVGPPVGVVLAVPLGLGLARGLRRRRRRRRGPGHLRIAQGWRDFVDHARDLGITVPPGLTRPQQARLVGTAELAVAADRAVFGPTDPGAHDARAYWDSLAQARRALTRSRPRVRRWLRLFSMRGLLNRDPRPVQQSRPPPRRGTGEAVLSAAAGGQA